MSNMSDSSEDLFSEELRKAVDAKNAACEKLPIGDISAGESEKENENGKESFKSPSKNRQVLAVLDETEEELKYRQKYAKTEKEVVKNLKLCCTVCSCSLQAALLKGRNLYHHPVLKVLMCKQCVDFYGDGNFSADEDGSDKYCRWCGQGGMLYCCSLCCCAFCKSCIKRNLGRSVLVDIEAEDWKCFVCNGEPLWDLRALCANARSYSEKTKRNKWVENQNDPKQMPLKDKPRQLHQWRKHPLVDSSSSDDDASSGNEQESYRNRCKQNDANTVDSGGRRKDGKKQNVKSCDPFMEAEIPNSGKKIICVQLSDSGENEKKIKSGPLTDNGASPTHFEGSSSNEGVRTDSSREKKRQGRTSKIRSTQTGKEESSIPRHAGGTDGERESKSKQEKCNGGGKELPQELDKRSAKLACQLLENCCKDLVDVGEVLVLRAQRCLEKKVNLKAMRNPKNVDKVVSSLQLLMKLARDNLHHIDEFLSLSHTRWIQGVVKRSSTKTGGSVDNEGKLEKSVTQQGRVDENMSMNGVGGDDMELHSHSENDSDNGKIENKETAEGQSDILCADSDNIKEMRMEKSKKRKFRKEWSGSDDNEVVNTGENEGNAEKSVIRDKKRKKLADGLDMEIDEVVDPDTRTSENCMGDSVCVMKGSSNQNVTELRDELGEEAVKDMSTDATECGRDSEVKKVSDRDKRLSGASEEREEDNVCMKNVEDTSSLHEPSDRLTLLETESGDDSTVWSQAGFESVSTLQLLDEKRSVVSDILTDPEKSVVHVEETSQQKSHKKSDEGQDYEQLNAESEAKHTRPVKNDGDLAAIDEDSKNGDCGDVAVVGGGSKNNDSGDLAAVDEDSKNIGIDTLAAMGEGSKSDNCDNLTAAGEGSKDDDSDTLTAGGVGSKSDDSGALTAAGGGSKSDNSDALTAVVEGSKSDDNDALTVVSEGSKSDGSDALTAVSEGSKSDDDALTAAGEGSKSDDNDALTALGEGSKSDDNDALTVVGEGSKRDNNDALTAAGEGSKSDDNDGLTAVGEGSKSDDNDGLTAVGEGSKSKEDKNNSDSDADTIECLFSDVGEKSLSDEDVDNGKNEKLTSADNLSSIKKHPEENKETDGEVKISEDMPVSLEVPDNVEKDSGSTIHPYITVRDIKELLMEKYVTESNESNGEEICQDLEKDTGKKDEVKGRFEDDDKQRSSDIGSLKLSDSMSECEREEKDGEEDTIEVDEDNAAAGDKMEEGATDTLKYTEECMKAQQSVLAYTTDNEDTSADSLPEKKKRKTHSRKTKQEVAALKGTKPAKKQLVGSKSQPHKGSDTVSSSVSSTDIDSECSMGRKLTKLKEGRKQKFRLRDTEAYKQDEKLQWKCTVLVERLSDEVFQKYYEEYCTDGDDGSEKKAKASSDIHSLINLKSLEKRRTNKYDTDDTDTEDSIDVGKKKSRKITKKDKNKEQEQKLINFFNQMDDDDDNMRASTSDPEEEATKTPRTKKSFCDKESEMVMKELLASSTDDTDTDSSEKQESLEENKKKEIKPKEKTDGTEAVIKKEEEKEQEVKEEKADSCPSDGDVSSDDSEVLKRKRNWRRNKLLTARLSDPDTSDEERRWKTKKEKEKEQKENNDDSEEKSACEMKPRKKKLRRRILGSDEDPDVIISSSEDDSSEGFVNKRKKPAKKSYSGKDSTSDTDTGRKKVKRRRIKAPADDSSSSEGGQVECSQKSDTPGKGRKNIHRIMKDADVGEATRRAAREEEERRKRMSEKQKLYNEIYKEVEGVQVFDKLVLDFDPETKEELVAVDPYIVSKLKPHQVKGVKFMWDVCFESLKQTEKSKGSGCILAHCMGLGKTLQVVALVHTLLNHKDTKVHTVLVVCPLSTVLNWVNEFNIWLKDIGDGEEVNVFELSKYKQNYERMYQLKEWQDCGGVMVMGYDMFRILTNPKAARIRKKAIETFQSTLIDPGPDLVVCDEGHMLKNEDTALSKAMNRIKTLRRIVLTGTPLQNNLKEYHCMVQFVKPNLLGTQKEFRNRFMNPISNGQFEDSTAHDVKIMKRRAHVLHKMLEGSVQRFDYSVLTPFLPPKHEYVISIRLSEVQIKAYRYYLENCAMGKSGVNSRGTQLFNDYQNLSRIWTHPRVLQMSAENAEKNAEKKRLMESDSEGSLRDFIDDGDADDTETTESSDKSSSDESDVQVIAEGGEKKSKSTCRNTRSTRSKGLVEEPEVVDVDEVEESKPVVWWKQFIEGDEIENIKYSGKLVLLFAILRECEKIGDKVLVFSQSLYSLDLIEYFLACVDTATQASETKESLDNNTGSWSLGLDYFRLDGSTSAENRSIWCRAFNREDNHRARLFIISTRAGGLGINLFAANRVIVFDASWNPSHDVQSIFRVYRFGQKKPCYIYRFLAQGTMEEKIYDRQVTKLSLSCRVVDEQQIERHYNMADLQELYKFNPEEKTKRPTPILPKDRLLAELLKDHEQWIVTYHEHDSLLENKEEEELNEEERKAAWEDYENEKKGKILPAPGVVFNAPRTLNVAALRETLRKENPHVTEEELDLRLSTVVNQIYDYVNSSKHGMPSSNVQQYTPGHIQALRLYQMQQEQFFRAQQQEQQRMQQQNVMWPMPSSYPNTDMSFRQYLQNQNQTNLSSGVYPTNLYRNVAVDRPGILRMQQKLVPFNAPGSSSRTVLQNVGGNMGGPEVMGRLPGMLPRLPIRTTQPPFSLSSSRVNQRQDVLQQYDAQQLRGSTTSVPHDVIETID